MLKELFQRFTAGLASAVLIAVAAGIALVAAAFAAYAGLKTIVSPAAASALTALIFAVVAGLIAVLAPKIIAAKPKPEAHPAKPIIDHTTMRTISEVAIAVLGVATDMARQRQLKRQRKSKDAKALRRH